MGGDDLGSEDEFLTAPIRGNLGGDDSDSEVSAQDDTESHEPIRQRDPEQPRPSKKRRKYGNDPLRDMGSKIISSPSDVQSKLISDFAGVRFLQHQLAKSESEDSPGAMKRIQGIISKKKLKKWKTKSSPCVLILCLSARRAVHMLKELAPFNVRAAKLFAKHITIEEQARQLEESAFAFAVGTPHRILTLIEEGSLSLESTQYVMLDGFVNDKKFSVYTLPDTVPHTQSILKEHVHPQCQKRRDLRLAFV